MHIRKLFAKILICTLIVCFPWSLGIAGPAYCDPICNLTVQQLNGGLNKAPSLQQKGFILIDVRSQHEHFEGIIPGTDMNIDYQEIGKYHQEIGAKLDDHIVVYCQSGHRSNIAAITLKHLGYKYVYNVLGSMNEWKAAGYPIEYPRR